jgi:hypothetical protein
MPAPSPVKKENMGLGGSRMGTKENKIAKAGRQCSWECCVGQACYRATVNSQFGRTCLEEAVT